VPAMKFSEWPLGPFHLRWPECDGESLTQASMSSPDKPPPDHELLTPREAFLAMTDFIWQFAQRAGDDLMTLIGDTGIEADGGPTDPAAWDDWLGSVAKIRARKPPRSDP
jgi:hypothetical protein